MWKFTCVCRCYEFEVIKRAHNVVNELITKKEWNQFDKIRYKASLLPGVVKFQYGHRPFSLYRESLMAHYGLYFVLCFILFYCVGFGVPNNPMVTPWLRFRELVTDSVRAITHPALRLNSLSSPSDTDVSEPSLDYLDDNSQIISPVSNIFRDLDLTQSEESLILRAGSERNMVNISDYEWIDGKVSNYKK